MLPLGSILPIRFALDSVNQMLQSGPRVIPSGTLFPVGVENSETIPSVVIFPILLPVPSVNQMFPSVPSASSVGAPLAVKTGNSVRTPAMVSRATIPGADCANQRLASAPTAIPAGMLLAEAALTASDTEPSAVDRRTSPAAASVNHRWPSGPSTTPAGSLSSAGSSTSLISPDADISAILFAPTSAGSDSAGPVSVNHNSPSGPIVMCVGLPFGDGIGKWDTACVDRLRVPMLFASNSANQRFRSGPTAIPAGRLACDGSEVTSNSLTLGVWGPAFCVFGGEEQGEAPRTMDTTTAGASR